VVAVCHDTDMDNTKEQWKPVVGYEKFYECSNLGRFRSLPKVVGGRWGECRYKGKIIKTMKSKVTGYGLICLVKEDRQKTTLRAHRLIAETFIPNPGGRPYVNHIDLDKMNNSVENLEWVTPKENIEHARASREWNTLRGEAAPNSKMKEHEVLQVRKLFSNGMRKYKIAQHFGVSKNIVADIIFRKTWKHL